MEVTKEQIIAYMNREKSSASTYIQIMEAHDNMVRELSKPGPAIMEELTGRQMEMLHMAIGIVTEATELLDAVKNHVIRKKPLDLNNILEEMGDIQFYYSRLEQITGLYVVQAKAHNLLKLKYGTNARYAQGYSDQAAIDRNDKNPDGSDKSQY